MSRPLALSLSALLAATPAPAAAADASHDFDFWRGTWRVHNRRLEERLKGSTKWLEFESTIEAGAMPGGLGSQDVYRTEFWPGFVGVTFRIYDPATRRWSIYWVDNRHRHLDPPVVGAFQGDVGVFETDDVFEGRPIRVRFTWTRLGAGRARWGQAFSPDGGKSWETNWVMEHTRIAG